MPKPTSDLERYLAGEFAEAPDALLALALLGVILLAVILV